VPRSSIPDDDADDALSSAELSIIDDRRLGSTARRLSLRLVLLVLVNAITRLVVLLLLLLLLLVLLLLLFDSPRWRAPAVTGSPRDLMATCPPLDPR